MSDEPVDDLLETLDERIEKAKDGKRRAAERRGDFYGLSQREWAERVQAFQTARKDVTDHFDH